MNCYAVVDHWHLPKNKTDRKCRLRLHPNEIAIWCFLTVCLTYDETVMFLHYRRLPSRWLLWYSSVSHHKFCIMTVYRISRFWAVIFDTLSDIVSWVLVMCREAVENAVIFIMKSMALTMPQLLGCFLYLYCIE